MSELVFLLEEPSAQAMLEGLLPRLMSNSLHVRYIVFEGKQDLDRNLLRRLRLYRTPGAFFVVLRDKDSSDCLQVKRQLREKCVQANRPDALVRIACHELESWYIGDLNAVSKGLGIDNLQNAQQRAKFRKPDALANAAEELYKLTNGFYQKISGSRAIGPHLDLESNASHSFKVFLSGLQRIISNASETTGDVRDGEKPS